MPATDYQSSSSFLFNRPLSKHNQIHTMDTHDSPELDSFQRQVASRFQALASVPPESLLTLSWVRSLLDAFLCCQEEFRMILYNNKNVIAKAPLEKMVSDYFERSVKALDVCNAIRDGVGQVKEWKKMLEIVKNALDCEKLGEGHFRRAKKALVDLALCMLDEKDSSSAIALRNRSFNKNNGSKEGKGLGHFRSLSWSVSRGWSASKQIQAIGNLSVPKTSEIVATNGLAVAVFTMSSVLYFVTWVLVAAIPCQDRGLHNHFNMPRQFAWASPILSIHDRILEESKKRDRRSACGLMREIHRMEILSRVMNELTDSIQYPINEEKEGEVKEKVRELGDVLEAVKEGLGPLESGVREAFRGIVRSRTEGLDSFSRLE